MYTRNFAKKRTEYFKIKQTVPKEIKSHSIFQYHLKNTSYDFKKEAKNQKVNQFHIIYLITLINLVKSIII